MTNDNPRKNIYKHGNKWRIQKEFDGQMYLYGSYAKLEDAMKVRDLLETINYGFELNPMRNISYIPEVCRTKPWYLRKFRDGRSIYNGTFATLEEAQAERGYMESVDWDWELTNGAGEMTEDELLNGSDWIRPKGIHEEHPYNDFYFPKGVKRKHFEGV